LAFDLEGVDSHATALPPAPSVASAQTAAEQVEPTGLPCCAMCRSSNTQRTRL
jgi:hypothetical protein